MIKDNLLFLDTETTGNDVEIDRLCQVCYKANEEIFSAYFKPPLPISVKSMSITHITNKLVEDKEVFKGSKMEGELQGHLENKILVAHNAKFDVAMLMAEGLSVPKSICTLRLVRYLDKEAEIPEYNLQFLRYYYGLEIDVPAHDAVGDVKILEGIFNVLYKKMEEKMVGVTEEDIIAEMIEISGRPTLIRKFTFGKYRGSLLEEIAITDPSYLQWLLRQKQEAKDEDWIYSLQYHLDKENSTLQEQ